MYILVHAQRESKTTSSVQSIVVNLYNAVVMVASFWIYIATRINTQSIIARYIQIIVRSYKVVLSLIENSGEQYFDELIRQKNHKFVIVFQKTSQRNASVIFWNHVNNTRFPLVFSHIHNLRPPKSRVWSYQTIRIEFDAFSHHYKIELEHNTAMRPSNIKHTNGIPLHTVVNEYYTSLTESCHYYGKVLSDTTDPLQRVSLSFCDKRGIRGEIRAFNETIIIKPSKYYLDTEYDNHNFHHITDVFFNLLYN